MSHNRILPEKRSIGNPDPSRPPSDAGIRADGRDDRAVLRGCAGGGGWRDGAARAALLFGKRNCNSVVRDRSVRRSRTPRGIPRRPVDEGPPRHEDPCAPTGGAGQRRPIMAG
jgi:hypothetical protein